MRRKHAGTPTPGPAQPTSDAVAEVQAFIEQARWLLEYHDRRSDGLNQRAVAVLGFTGVLIALVPNALRIAPDIRHPNLAVQITFWAALALLVTTAAAALAAVQVGGTGAPGVAQLRSLLHDHLTGARVGRAHADVAATYLHPMTLDDPSPLDLAAGEAGRRAVRLKWAVRSLAAALVALAALVAELFVAL